MRKYVTQAERWSFTDLVFFICRSGLRRSCRRSRLPTSISGGCTRWWNLWWFTERVSGLLPPAAQEIRHISGKGRKCHVSRRQFSLCFSPGACATDLSSNTASFAKSVAMLGSAEDNTALSRALSQLAEVEDKMEQLHQDQAANDTFSFAEVIADYIRLLGAVRVRRGMKRLRSST